MPRPLSGLNDEIFLVGEKGESEGFSDRGERILSSGGTYSSTTHTWEAAHLVLLTASGREKPVSNNLNNPCVPIASNKEIDRLLSGINFLRREIAETEASIERAVQRQGYANDTIAGYLKLVDKLYALKLDLAGSEWILDDILIKRFADHGIYTAANLQMFRRQP